MGRSGDLSIGEARRLSLGAQGFGDPRPAKVDRRHLRKVMNRLQLVQLDSVPVVARTQYLVFFSRLGAYDMGLLDRVAYRDDEWFESWAHEASVLPVEHEPWLRWLKARHEAGQAWKGLVRLAREEPAYVQSVLDQVAERGPLRANELDDPRPREGEWWGSRSMGTLALDWLFRIGAVGVRRDRAFAKEFDLLERIVPPEVITRPTPSEHDAMRELLCRSAQALGVGTADDLVDYFRLPKREGKALLPGLVEDGLLEQVSVEGWSKPAYVRPRATIPRRIDARALLSPFDPVVWFRERAERLFDFRYRIEIYVPAAKRVYGYYVLPFLMGDRLVGRFDLKTNRADDVLEVRGSYIEDHADPTAVAEAAAAELRGLAALVSVNRVEVADRGDLAPALRRAMVSG